MIYFFSKNKEEVFAVASVKKLSAEDIKKLEWLFSNAYFQKNQKITGNFIGPRSSMPSPWSTNAVEITQNMGIEDISRIEKYVRETINLQHVQMGRFRTDQIVNNLDIRIEFLEKTIDEKKFKSDILRRDKAFEKKQDIFNVLQLQVNTVTDIVYRLENNLQDYHIIEFSEAVDYFIQQLREHIIEIENITNYCNNLLIVLN